MKVLQQLLTYNWQVVVFFLFLVEFLINPIGEFALNDDWAYARTVYDFINTGDYKLSFWQSIFGFTQFAVGVIFCKLFCFSFTLLRCISILCLVISVYFFDKILKQFRVESSLRLMLLLLFTFNPLTISLSNTFLSDIFQMPLTLASFFFMLKFVSNEKWYFFVLFNLFLILAILNRQNGIVFSIIFLFAYFHQKNVNIKNGLFALLPFSISIFFIWLFKAFILNNTELAPNLNLQWYQFENIVSSSFVLIIKKFFYYLITSSLMLGLFILPLSISKIKLTFTKLKSSFVLLNIFGVYVLLIIGKLIFSGSILPFVGNIFYHVGAGPIILTGFDTNYLNTMGISAKILWILLNFIGGFSFLASTIMIFLNQTKKINLTCKVFLLLLVLYLLPLCFNYVNDRYLFYLLPFYFISFIDSANVNFNKLYFFILFIPLLYFSVVSTHDYLEINRSRKNATEYLLNKNITANKIDGGFEFNAWYFAGSRNYNPHHKGRWWWVQDDEYIISPFVYDGYLTETEFHFSPWLFFHFTSIKVLKREAIR